jgi:hypothetical protein
LDLIPARSRSGGDLACSANAGKLIQEDKLGARRDQSDRPGGKFFLSRKRSLNSEYIKDWNNQHQFSDD